MNEQVKYKTSPHEDETSISSSHSVNDNIQESFNISVN